ncbi:MAG TPA: DNA-binding protein [Cyanobacteria bacterium UBA11159]|nr:DNA-binding protein [Cyanobacteria bacterium UBA11159]HCA94376.1 DNA-binding protein [Cyanobacteria bacterium UBA9226]
MTRLFRLKSGWRNNSQIKNDVTNNGAYRSIERLWRQLARSLLLPADTEPEKIMAGICDRWQTQDVIIIFDKVDFMPPNILATWLDVFWKPLVKRARQKLPEKDTNLLLFLLDNDGKVGQSNLMVAEQFRQINDPIMPLKLPGVSPFSLEVITDWMDMVTAMESVPIPDGLTAQSLFDNSENGIPQYLYEEICDRFGYSWEGGLAKWLI